MTTAAILPIKSFSDAKSRLAGHLSPGPRRALTEAMFGDVLIALRRAATVELIVVVSNDAGAQQIAGGHGAEVVADAGEGHSEAAALGAAWAVERGAERVLMVPGDCPTLLPSELDELLALPHGERSALIVADRHGTGTNALLLSPPDSLTPAFGPGSRDRHLRLAREQGAAGQLVEVAGLALDVDTPDDLAALQATLAATRGGAAHTRGMLSQYQRTRA